MGQIGDAVLRWWKLSLVGTVVVLAAGLVMALSSSPSYSYTATFLLLPPRPSSVAPAGTIDYARGNPLFYLGSLNQARDILIGELASRNAQAKLMGEYPQASYAVTPDVFGSSPVVVVTAESSNKRVASGLVSQVGDMVPSTLANLQQRLGIKDASAITAQQLNMDRAASVSHKSQIRSGVAAGGAVGLLLLGLIALLDAWRTSGSRDLQPPLSSLMGVDREVLSESGSGLGGGRPPGRAPPVDGPTAAADQDGSIPARHASHAHGPVEPRADS